MVDFTDGDFIECVLNVGYEGLFTIGKTYKCEGNTQTRVGIICDQGWKFYTNDPAYLGMFRLVVPSVNSVTSTQTLSNGQPQVYSSPASGWSHTVSFPHGISTPQTPPVSKLDYKEGDEIVCTGFDPAYSRDFTIGRVYKVFKNFVHLKVKTDTNWEFILGDEDVSFAPRYSQGVLPNSTECRHDWKEYFGLNQRDYYCAKTGCKARKPYE